MKTSDGFVKTTIAGIPYLLPYGQKIADHARSLRLNDSGALLWDTLSLGADKSTLLSVLANYYNTDADMLPQLTSDLDSYLASLKQLGMLSYNAPAETSHRILIRPTIRFLHCFLTIVLQNIIRSAVSAFHGLARTICLIPILKISPAKLLWLISAFL